MKKIQSIIVLLVFLLVSCVGQEKPAPISIPSLTTRKVTESPFITTTPRLTWTPSLSRTPLYLSSTPSISRTRKITLTPSFTPPAENVFQSTYNPKTAVTRTPPLQQKCPTLNPTLTPDFPFVNDGMPVHYSEYWPKAMEFLNAGGNPSLLRNYIVGTDPRFGAEVDLTGDGNPELVIINWGGEVDILTCIGGRYIDALPLMTGMDLLDLMAIRDMNLDGIPEIVFSGGIISAGILAYYIYEWNGTSFQSLIWSEVALSGWFYSPAGKAMNWYTYWSDISLSDSELIEGPSAIATIKDTDGNGTLELILHDDTPYPKYIYDGPWRGTTKTYQWNGHYFALDRLDIVPPVYRFQAVQDADRLSVLGKYPQALGLYQQVISSHALAAWSLDQYHSRFEAGNSGTKTPTLIPFDQEESSNLAAYALYRIMLLQVVQNETSPAQLTYDRLEKAFPSGQSGNLYAELATQFWEKYSASKRISEGCTAVIQFADMHKDDIFTYLGNRMDYAGTHGNWSHYYSSWDLCPFQ